MLATYDLSGALIRNEFFLVYQPLFRVYDHQPEGMEALIRWDQPGYGIVPPDEFIHLIEGQSVEMDFIAWMLRTTSQTQRQWLTRRHDLSIAINVSPPMLTKQLVALIDRLWPPSMRLELEITERLPLESKKESEQTVQLLKKMGIRILFDDFRGTNSCTARLNALDFSGIKFDRSLMPIGPDFDPGKLQGLVQMARAKGLRTTAEGVVHPAQINAAQIAGIDRWQGYLGARPMTENESMVWVREQTYRKIRTADHRPFSDITTLGA